MPHVIIELSRNVADRVDVPNLVQSVHRSLCDTAMLPVKAIKTRAIVHDQFAIGEDQTELQGFAIALIRIQPGRPLESEKAVAQAAFDTISTFTAALEDLSVSISVDVQHIFRDASFSQIGR